MTFCEKIRNILKDNEFKITSASMLEEFCGLGRSSITPHYSKKGPCPNSEPGQKVQTEIQEKLRINKKWWDTGKGEMYLPQSEKKDKLRDVDIIEAENYIGMHRRVYDAIEKSLHYFQEIATQAQKNANDLTQILGRRSGPGNDSPQV